MLRLTHFNEGDFTTQMKIATEAGMALDTNKPH